MKSYRLSVLAAVAFAVACGAASNPDVAASAGDQQLSVTRLADILGTSQAPLEKDVARSIAELWVNYQLVGVASAEGDSLSDKKTMDQALWSNIDNIRVKKFYDNVSKGWESQTPGPDEQRYMNGEAMAARHILVKVEAAGVNRPDVAQRIGRYPPPPGASDLPGLEIAGEVVALGDGVTGWRIGDKVCALLPGGGYAEYAACAEAHALPIPQGLSLRDAACLPETCFTVWSNVVMRGGLKAGERFLVHGGTSGIGVTAIQIAKALGARVFATAGNDDKVRICEGLGAEMGLNYRTQDWAQILRKAGGMNLILDMVGGTYLPQNLRSLADDGRLVQIAFLQGAKVEVNFAELMMRRLTLTGSTLRPQSDLAKARIAAEVEAHVWPMVALGKVKVVLDSEFPLTEAAAAHARIEAPDHIGKIVLKVQA